MPARLLLLGSGTPESEGRLHRSSVVACGIREENAMWVLQKTAKRAAAKGKAEVRIYTLEVFLLSGPVTRRFVEKNPVVSRTIQMRGDQTLEDRHHAIFDAYGRWEEHMYEFQFGKGPMDPRGRRYVLPNALTIQKGQPNPPKGRVDLTTLDSLRLKVGRRFGYWFDFGDDWWHQINVEGVEETVTRAKFPKVIKRVGKSPPQYADWEKEEG
jgi:hypothetical protein